MTYSTGSKGLAGANAINGSSSGEHLNGGAKSDLISGLGGDDFLNGGAGDDMLDGGSGSDKVNGDAGADVLVYVASENKSATVNSADTYNGGSGVDTLRLVLTRAEWMSEALQSDIANYLVFMAANTEADGQATNAQFAFSAFGLTVAKIEKLQVSVDGVSIDPANHAVTLGDDAVSTTENAASAAIDVLANDSVPDLIKSLTYTNPAHGAVQLSAAYSDTAAAPGATFVYTPIAGFYDYLAAGESATDTFTYTVTDATGDASTATVTVTITGTNDAPTIAATVQAGAVSEANSAAELHSSGAFVFQDLDLSDTHSAAVGAASVSASASIPAGFVPAGGFGSLSANVVPGKVEWNFSANDAALQGLAAGETVTQAYTVTLTDSAGAAATQVVTITLAGTNDAPVITSAAQAAAVSEGDGAPLAAMSATGTISFTDADLSDAHILSIGAAPNHGSAAVDAQGNWSYSVADAGAVNALALGQHMNDSFTVLVDDGHGGTASQLVSIDIVGTNDAPVVTSLVNAGTVSEGDNLPAGARTASGQVSFSDADTADTHSVSISGGAQYGNAAVDATGAWTYSLNVNAQINALGAGQHLADSFTVLIDDGHGGVASQPVSIDIVGTNDGPVALADARSTSEDSPLSVTLASLLANDTDVDNGDSLSVLSVGNATNGSAVLSGSNVIFTPAANYSGNASFSYTVNDSAGATSTATVTVAVAPVTDQPTLNVADVSGPEDQPIALNIGAALADTDGSETLALVVGGVPALARLSAGTSLGNGSWSVTPAQLAGLSFIPASDFSGTVTLNVSATATETASGTSVTSNAALTVSVTPVNDAPAAVDDSGFANAGGSVTLNVLANDSDPEGDALSVTSVGNAAHGTVTLGANGLVTYTPVATYSGNDTFNYTITDSNGATDVATVSLIVGIANHQKVGGDVFLQGNYMEIGVSSAGSLGTASAAPAGYHPINRSNISFRVDSDGWNTGAAPNSGDFTLPGSPVDVIAVAYNGQAYANDQRSGYIQIAASTTDTSSGGGLSASTTGTAESLKMTQVVTLDPSATYYSTTVTLTNTSAGTMNNVRFMRSFDPDQDLDSGGGYGTYNDVLANPNTGGSIAAASAVGGRSGVGVVLVAFDASARASNFGFANYNPNVSAAWDSPQDANGQFIDAAISLTFNTATLGAGQSVTRTFYTTMNLSSNASDMRIGGGGADVLSTGNGDDYLIGLRGNDTLTGGSGDDKFAFTSGEGNDRITDFTAGAGTADTIVLTGIAGIASFAQVLAATTQSGADAVIHLSGSDSITLTGVNVAQLSASDFMFA